MPKKLPARRSSSAFPETAPSPNLRLSPRQPLPFKNTDNPVTKTRLILQNPDFLNLALKQDPDSVMELAALFDKMAHVLHMEMDDKLRPAPGALEHNAPLLEQQAASAQRMRI